MPSDALPDDLETLKAMLLAEQCESERLRQIIKELQPDVVHGHGAKGGAFEIVRSLGAIDPHERVYS